jgi:uncharacterized protein
MQYNVAQLLKGPTGGRRRYTVDEDISGLDSQLEPIDRLVGAVTLTRTSQGILVTGQLRTTLRVECRRCLEPFELGIEFGLEEEFHPVVPVGDAPLDRVPDEDNDEALLIDEHQILDLSEVVRQALWLAEPARELCRPDCAGLCPRCGGNRNLGECECVEGPLDPRWATLQSLLTEAPDS